MLKRLATLLFGIALIGMGVYFFVSPERATALQYLSRFWPIFLILAGGLRVFGYLIDRHPRSPVGGMLLLALGGILLASIWRGEHTFFQVAGTYWFFFLLAFVLGRLLRQYTHRPEDGRRYQTFSPGGIAAMILIVGVGMTSHYVATKRINLNVGLGRFGLVKDYLFGSQLTIEDPQAQIFTLPPNGTLKFSDLPGEIEISAMPQATPSARLIKHIRSTSQTEAEQVAQRIKLEIAANGSQLHFQVRAQDIQQDFQTKLVITLPQTKIDLELVNILGAVRISGNQGNLAIRGCEQLQISQSQGLIDVASPRGAVEISQIRGGVTLRQIRRAVELREIEGPVSLEAQGGSIAINKAMGEIAGTVSDSRIELKEIRLASGQAPPSGKLIRLENVRNSRFVLEDIKGSIHIDAEQTGIEAEAIEGDLSLGTSGQRVRVAQMIGQINISAEDGTVEVSDLKGSAKIEATRDIAVRNFKGQLDVASRLGSITLSTEEKLTAPLKVTNDRGRTKISIPGESEFRLDAESDHGRVRISGFEKMVFTRQERSVAAGYHLLETGPSITIRTGNGEIQLVGSP